MPHFCPIFVSAILKHCANAIFKGFPHAGSSPVIRIEQRMVQAFKHEGLCYFFTLAFRKRGQKGGIQQKKDPPPKE